MPQPLPKPRSFGAGLRDVTITFIMMIGLVIWALIAGIAGILTAIVNIFN